MTLGQQRHQDLFDRLVLAHDYFGQLAPDVFDSGGDVINHLFVISLWAWTLNFELSALCLVLCFSDFGVRPKCEPAKYQVRRTKIKVQRSLFVKYFARSVSLRASACAGPACFQPRAAASPVELIAAR